MPGTAASTPIDQPRKPGSYEVEVVICTNSPFPDPCTVRATLPLTVFGNSGARFKVPALSGAVAIGLVFAMMAIGALGSLRGSGI